MAWALAWALLSALGATADAAELTPIRLVTVFGEAQTRVAPDEVFVYFSLGIAKATAEESLASNTEAMTAFEDALKGVGVQPQDMSTLGPSVQQVANWKAFGSGAKFGGVSEALYVHVRKLDQIGDVVRIAETRGVGINGFHYDISDRKAREDALRVAAVADARHSAEIYATALGMRLGQPRAVVEEGAGLLGAMARNAYQQMIDTNFNTAGAIVLKEVAYVSFELTPP